MDYSSFTNASWEKFRTLWKRWFPKVKKTFMGSLDEWNALTPAEQAEYDLLITPDGESNIEPWEDITNQINIVIATGSSYLQNLTVTPSYCYKHGKFMTFEANIQATAAEIMPTSGYKSLRFFVQSNAFSTNISMGATGALGWHTTQQTFTATGNIGTDGNADEHSIRCNILFKDNIEATYNVFIRWTQPIN